ncbi:MAG: hypothetical protein JW801_01390 [Bacteroidales bacterium]|nr:hypothetical protein [Bacteroidales bacterium]
MSKPLLIIALLVYGWVSFGQEPLQHEKKTYTAPDGKLYIQKSLPIYLWLSTSEDEDSEMHRLMSEETREYSNPMYLDTEGYNTVRSPSCVDPVTRKTIYPERDIIFEIYSDSYAPVTSVDYGDATLYREGNKLHIGGNAVINLASKDAGSGVGNIYFSLDGAAYQPFSSVIKLEQEKEYMLKYYAVDHVGNVEEVHEQVLVLDKNAPVSNLEIEGDRHENVISARSKIILSTDDKGTGVKVIYYVIDENAEKAYTYPIQAAYLSQDEHSISYYAIDKVGNKEAVKRFDFYVDKTAPTIIEEVVGKSFFAGGKEFSSGRSQLKLTSFDNKAGVKEVRYSVNDGEYLVYENPVNLTQSSGNLLIKSYAVDYVNNRSTSQTANEKTNIPYIDLTGPKLTYGFQGPEFTTRDTLFICSKTQIALKASDSEAGINRIAYAIDGGNPMDYDKPFSIAKEGYSQIEYTGYDNVDNTSREKFGVKVDNGGPAIMVSFGTRPLGKKDGLDVYPSHTVVFMSATDAVVGFKNITYSLDGTAEKLSTGMLQNLAKGKHKLHIKAFDQLGNYTESTLEFSIE